MTYITAVKIAQMVSSRKWEQFGGEYSNSALWYSLMQSIDSWIEANV
jgi:hypothetical protein